MMGVCTAGVLLDTSQNCKSRQNDVKNYEKKKTLIQVIPVFCKQGVAFSA